VVQSCNAKVKDSDLALYQIVNESFDYIQSCQLRELHAIVRSSGRWQEFSVADIYKIRTYRTQTPYTFFGHKAFTAIPYPGDGAKSQPTGCIYLSFDFLSLQIFTTN
jgi:hypothetical protein